MLVVSPRRPSALRAVVSGTARVVRGKWTHYRDVTHLDKRESACVNEMVVFMNSTCACCCSGAKPPRPRCVPWVVPN